MSEQPSFLAASQWSDPLANKAFASFVEDTFDKAEHSHIGVFIDRSILPASRSLRSRVQDRTTRMLTRTNTGVSFHSNYENQLPVLSPSTNGYHILVPFSGGEDDCLAMRLALQIAHNEDVTATILLMTQASSSTMAAPNATDDAVFFFRAMKSNLPAPLVTRVVFEECVGEVAEVLKSAISGLDRAFSSGDKPEQIILYGASAPQDMTGGSPDHLTARVLNASIMTVIRETGFETSLFVVLAKEGGQDSTGVLKRQRSHVSEIQPVAKGTS
jgi:hypothetical protein